MNEFSLQILVHKYLSEPSKIFLTKSNKRLQILSPGRLNREEGPDFLDIAILLDGNIVIGDAEFHKKSSDWVQHRHSTDPKYRNVCLHIVLEDNFFVNEHFEVLIISKDDLLKSKEEFYNEINPSDNIIDEIQNYALIRLLRKTSEARLIFDHSNPHSAFDILFKNFLNNYLTRKHRPYSSKINVDNFVRKLFESDFFWFYQNILNGNDFNIPEKLFSLMKIKIDLEGPHLRQELIMNCLIPICIAISNDNSRISLFSWFWSTPALYSYGILTRKFPGFAQNYIWQQQGMLEILSNYVKKISTLTTSIQQFKIGEVLNFFYLGNPRF